MMTTKIMVAMVLMITCDVADMYDGGDDDGGNNNDNDDDDE